MTLTCDYELIKSKETTWAPSKTCNSGDFDRKDLKGIEFKIRSQFYPFSGYQEWNSITQKRQRQPFILTSERRTWVKSLQHNELLPFCPISTYLCLVKVAEFWPFCW